VIGDVSSVISISTAGFGIIPTPVLPYLLGISRTVGFVGIGADAFKVLLSSEFDVRTKNLFKLGLNMSMYVGVGELTEISRISQGIDITTESFLQFTGQAIGFSGGRIIGGNSRNFQYNPWPSSIFRSWNWVSTPHEGWDEINLNK